MELGFLYSFTYTTLNILPFTEKKFIFKFKKSMYQGGNSPTLNALNSSEVQPK